LCTAAAQATNDVVLELLGHYESGLLNKTGPEITAYDAASKRLFVVLGGQSYFEILNIADPARPALLKRVDFSALGVSANSIAIHSGRVAVAMQPSDKTQPGTVAFYDPAGALKATITVGCLPDMVCFTPDGSKVLTANEGEPSDDYSVDPPGSISIINVSGPLHELAQSDATTLGFEALSQDHLDDSLRIYGPGADLAADLEPEYIAVAPDSGRAWATLQENNALAFVDLEAPRIAAVKGLGFKDFSQPNNKLDASDKDGGIALKNWPVFGMYQPDAVAVFEAHGETWLITADEGDVREYAGFEEAARIADLELDAEAFPEARKLQQPANIGRLQATTAMGDEDGDGDYESLYAFGGRSFSIRRADGMLVYNSGDALARLIQERLPKHFNSDDDDNDSFDKRSDNRGVEPEDVEVAEVFGRTLAFLGLERVGGIVVIDVSQPRVPEIVGYVNTRDFAGSVAQGTAGDVAPEGLLFIPAADSPTGEPLLACAYEMSGTVAVYAVREAQGAD
jgi:hypothetical protein